MLKWVGHCPPVIFRPGYVLKHFGVLTLGGLISPMRWVLWWFGGGGLRWGVETCHGMLHQHSQCYTFFFYKKPFLSGTPGSYLIPLTLDNYSLLFHKTIENKGVSSGTHRLKSGVGVPYITCMSFHSFPPQPLPFLGFLPCFAPAFCITSSITLVPVGGLWDVRFCGFRFFSFFFCLS